MSSPLVSSDSTAKLLFPTALPVSMRDLEERSSHGESSFHSADRPPMKDFRPASPEKYNNCNPPCIQNRGVCNDNLCFCKSPYTGTTCQHEVSAIARVSYPMVVGFSIVIFVMGIL